MAKKSSNFDIGENILKDPMIRKKLAWESHYWFFHIYLSDYITYETAKKILPP